MWWLVISSENRLRLFFIRQFWASIHGVKLFECQNRALIRNVRSFHHKANWEIMHFKDTMKKLKSKSKRCQKFNSFFWNFNLLFFHLVFHSSMFRISFVMLEYSFYARNIWWYTYNFDCFSLGMTHFKVCIREIPICLHIQRFSRWNFSIFMC